MNEKELAWKRYSMNIDIYQNFFDIVIKVNLFYYGITGALLSFYYTNISTNADLKYSLLFPALFSFALILLFSYGLWALNKTKEDIEECRKILEMNRFVSVDALIFTVKGSVFFFIITLVGLLYVFCA
jgi:hypothetical protein